MRLATLALSALLVACTTTQAPPVDRAAYQRLASDRLERFSGEAELRRYLRRVDALNAASRPDWRRYVQNCDPAEDPDCLPDDEIVVTGSRVSAAPPSITNTQTQGVDEGDIVKRVGDYLVILQDGRLFSVDMRGPLRLVDRINVYDSADADTWYDELLVFDDQLLVTGYSYGEDASELVTLRLGSDGSLSRTGRFFLTSDDYYDVDNYATRLVGNELVLYTPLDLTDLDLDEDDALPFPKIKPQGADARPVLAATDVLKPVQATSTPNLHTVTRCELGEPTLPCRSEAVIGPERAEWYVSNDAAFLWLSAGWDDLEPQIGSLRECPGSGSGGAFADRNPSTLFRFPHGGGRTGAALTRGMPVDQFAMLDQGGHFNALVNWTRSDCETYDAENEQRLPLRYVRFRVSELDRAVEEIAEARYVRVPDVPGRHAVNRFTDDHLVYAGTNRQWRFGYANPPREGEAVALPIARPRRAERLALTHGAIRAERVGDDIILTGHARDAGLYLSYVGLEGPPRVTDTLLEPGRYESEGRSHAFNCRVDADGSAVMGLPTSRRVQSSARQWWRSEGSDLSFFSVDASGRLSSRDALRGEEKDAAHPDYECEVSCVDWYGNTRPIFIGNRVFALMGTRLHEAGLGGQHVVSLREIDLTAPLQR